MKAIDLFMENVEYSTNDVLKILKENNLYSVTLFYNCYGWSTYFTTEPTFATPTGVLYKEGFPAKVKIEANYNHSESIIKPVKFLNK